MRFSRPLAGLAATLILALPALSGLRVAEHNATLDRLVSADRRALVLWTEQRVQNPEGEVVQHVDTTRAEGAVIADDLLASENWGLVARSRLTGRLDGRPAVLEVLELEPGIASMLGLRACDAGELRPFASTFKGQYLVTDTGAFRIGASAGGLPLALLTRKFDAELVRCTDVIESGPFMIVEVPVSLTEAAAAERLGQLSKEMFGSLMNEQVRVRDLQALLLEQQTLRAGWLRTVRWVLTGFCLILISTLLGLHAIRQSGGTAIRHVLGSVTRDQVLQRLREVMVWVLPSIALGGSLALLIGKDIDQSWIVLDALFLVLFCAAAAMFNAWHGSRRLMSSTSMLQRFLQGQWSTHGDRTLLTAWGLAAALLVCVSAVQGSLAARLHQLASIEWGYQVENLMALPVSLPDPDIERNEYADRIRTVVTEIEQFPSVRNASVISPGPWRFRGLERVSGPFIHAFGVGPDIAVTMRLNDYRGRDFTWLDMTSGQAQAYQNVSAEARRMMARFGPEIASLQGLGWDPLDPEQPQLLFKPITEILPASFELIWRGDSPTLPSAEQLKRIQRAWPEAVLDQPVRVEDVILERYSAMINLQRLSGMVLAASLVVALVLTGATLAQLITRHQRSLAIRVALGAAPGQALQPLLARILFTLAAGTAAGVFFAWVAGRAIGALIEQYQPQWLLSAIGTALVVVCVGAMVIIFAVRKLRRLDLHTLLSDLP